jgi:hypothetical protein
VDEKKPAEYDSIESNLRGRFGAGLQSRVHRYAKSRVHEIIPAGFFAAASTECRELFVAGCFYGCITLAQSVAEGLARFIAEKNSLQVVEDYRHQINLLQRNRSAPTISNQAYEAFRQIFGRPREDRNDFHQLNATVEQDNRVLESRALQCIESLYRIESEVFAIKHGVEGTIIPVHPQYWPIDGRDMAVFLRFG